ncbi:Got1 protein [Saccharomycopsis crataegensis]|uniref:Got1 protein n=1 Tax=Saccharomycopsis crataegensis TaxID=43959 RepID=A0AAV5QMW3_9ASCO|nr:Got1 protein [Saccharomycopsis crataegensis]
MLWLSEQQKFGAFFTAAGVVLFTLGVMFFFDSGLLAMGNVSFLIGVTLLIGPQKALGYFMRPTKIRGTICFAIGIFMIFMKHAFIGFAIECFGILFLFGDVLNIIVTFLRSMPVIGPILSHPSVAPFIDKIANVNVLPV